MISNQREQEDEARKDAVRAQLQRHVRTLQTLVSSRIGGPTGIAMPTYRVMRRTEENEWKRRVADLHEYVFCLNDLS